MVSPFEVNAAPPTLISTRYVITIAPHEVVSGALRSQASYAALRSELHGRSAESSRPLRIWGMGRIVGAELDDIQHHR
jgi:hypothetical protein